MGDALPFGGRGIRGGYGQRWRGRGRNGRGRGRGGRGGGRGRGRGRFHGRSDNQRSQSFDVSKDPIEILGILSERSINIAVEGCCHGELDIIYKRLVAHEKQTQEKVDLLICCGDFQSLRNAADFHSSSIPPKYRRLGSFPKYYSGEEKAPILTIFVGGNHEASQPLRELYYGGWVAPNIYYLGAAGVVRFGGIRIGGISGIYKNHHYKLGHFEHAPFDRSTLKSVYHVRNVDIFRMKCLSRDRPRLDIVVSHDWPLGIEQHGDTAALLRKKPYFRAEVERNDLGSPPNREVLDTVKPKWWFSAHLHVKFGAKVKHSTASTTSGIGGSVQLVPSQVVTKDSSHAKMEVGLEVDDKVEERHNDPPEETTFHGLESSDRCHAPDLTDLMTQFLALDKCLARRSYLSILHIDRPADVEDLTLEYDSEWLAILKQTHELTQTEHKEASIPMDIQHVTNTEVQWVEDRLANEGGLAIPHNFERTVPCQTDPIFQGRAYRPFPPMGNPQTDRLLRILDLEHIITRPYDKTLTPVALVDLLRGERQQIYSTDENEIDLDSETGVAEEVKVEVADENEIDIPSEGEEEDGSDEIGPIPVKKARIEETANE